MVASNIQALEAAKAEAQRLGLRAMILSSFIEGETRDVARMHAALALEVRASGNPVAPPVCFITGGETTVTLKGKGKGAATRSLLWPPPWTSPGCATWWS